MPQLEIDDAAQRQVAVQPDAEDSLDGTATELASSSKKDDTPDASTKRTSRFPQALVWG